MYLIFFLGKVLKATHCLRLFRYKGVFVSHQTETITRNESNVCTTFICFHLRSICILIFWTILEGPCSLRMYYYTVYCMVMICEPFPSYGFLAAIKKTSAINTISK